MNSHDILVAHLRDSFMCPINRNFTIKIKFSNGNNVWGWD
jgi:hypothetical protein